MCRIQGSRFGSGTNCWREGWYKEYIGTILDHRRIPACFGLRLAGHPAKCGRGGGGGVLSRTNSK